MKTPNCRNIVSADKLWNIAIEFIGRIDNNQKEYNLKLAYIVYKFSKISVTSPEITKNLVFLSCFYNVGKLNSNYEDTEFRTYLFLKYFSPLKDFSEILLLNSRLPIAGNFRICQSFTDNYIRYNDKNIALEETLKEKDRYNFVDINNLKKLIKNTDFEYEFNSCHYKTAVYQVISTMIFNLNEKNNFFNMLSSLFEMYSYETLNHSKTTAAIAYLLAENLNIPSRRCKIIYVAGLCHDLGKVDIPLDILEKQGKLTDEEFETMKMHVTYTKEILDQKIDYEIVELAYRHHERLNGSGYPRHLTHDQMTLDQEIIQVSDVISALLMKRSYKEEFSWDNCIQILESQVEEGKLNSTVVKCLKDSKDGIIDIITDTLKESDVIYAEIEKEKNKYQKNTLA
jgi:HD-GYP domain-containing protein (c-di-GMP phosphodiesterase class II)